MPSSSAAQHRWIGWLHSHPENRPASLSKSQVDEWLHADKGSPWQHKDDGGSIADSETNLARLGALNRGLGGFSGSSLPGGSRQIDIPVPAGGGVAQDYARYVLGDGGLAGAGAHLLRNTKFERPSQHFTDRSTFRPIPGYPNARQMTADDWDGGAASGSSEDYKGYDYGGGISGQYGNYGSAAADPTIGTAGIGLPMTGLANGVGDASVQGQQLPTPDPVSGGQAPSVGTQGQIAQQQYQRYAKLPIEKLQELAVQLPPNSQQGQIVRRVLQLQRMRVTQQQQGQDPQNPTGGADTQGIAAQQPASSSGGYDLGGPVHRQEGGMLGMPLSQADPWWTRAAERQISTGFLHGNTFGRADHVTTRAPGGAYVVPADVVSGLGQGNSLAGANVLQRMMESGPYGMALRRGPGGHSIPRPSAPAPEGATRGGHVGNDGVGKPVPVKFSHGEYVIKPEEVLRIARAHYGWHLPRDEAMTAAHELLDKWVVAKRKETAQKMLKLPGPTK